MLCAFPLVATAPSTRAAIHTFATALQNRAQVI
jgi:hypothetical protein